MKRVGITGGIGAGKSVVCDIFKTLGVPIYNADQRAKHLMSHDEGLKENIIAVFGEETYLDGKINRDHLAKVVFNSTNQISKLNLLVHPAVGADFQNWVDDQNTPYVVKEAALLIETESYKELDALISVMAGEDTRVARVIQRDPFRTEGEIRAILQKQSSDETRLEISDYLIDNNGTKMLIPQVLKLHRTFMS